MFIRFRHRVKQSIAWRRYSPTWTKAKDGYGTGGPQHHQTGSDCPGSQTALFILMILKEIGHFSLSSYIFVNSHTFDPLQNVFEITQWGFKGVIAPLFYLEELNG